MPYIIGNGKTYIHRSESNRYSSVDNISEASVWASKKKARNVIEHCLNKQLRKLCPNVISVDDSRHDECVGSNPIELGFDILEKADEISELARRAENRAAYLSEQIRQVDLSIVDIEHAAEFYNLNASQGYKLYKMLHDARIKRRELKNELDKIHYFLGSKTNVTGMENLRKSIEGLDNRQYRPRVINELFNV